MEGEVTVIQSGREIRVLGPGDGFGEIALLRASPADGDGGRADAAWGWPRSPATTSCWRRHRSAAARARADTIVDGYLATARMSRRTPQ